MDTVKALHHRPGDLPGFFLRIRAIRDAGKQGRCFLREFRAGETGKVRIPQGTDEVKGEITEAVRSLQIPAAME
jgi:hypothetical protein